MSKPPPHIPTPYEMLAAITQVRDLLETLDPALFDDVRLVIDTIEGETDAMLVLDQLGSAALNAEGLAEIAREHARALSERAARFEKRNQSLRSAMLTMMQTMRQQSVERPDFTVSVQQNQPELIIDEVRLPLGYMRVKTEPDRTLIRKNLKAGETIEGATLGNASQSIRIRT